MPRNNSTKPSPLSQAQANNRAKLANAKARRKASEPERKARTKAHLAAKYQEHLRKEAERNKPWTCRVCTQKATGDRCQNCNCRKGAWVCWQGHINRPRTYVCDATVVVHGGHYIRTCGERRPTYDDNLGAGGR